MKGILATLTFFLITILSSAQTISGYITSENVPIVGATVIETGTENHAITNTKGFYSLTVENAKGTLLIKSVGFAEQTFTYNLNGTSITKNFEMKPIVVTYTPLVVTASRVSEKGPSTNETFTDFTAKPPLDVPALLNEATSLTFTSDAGNGVGYTSLRIRGMDATRINVTVNGIPINDQESHGVFWVNMPDLASSASAIQVQRGVGSSTNGGQAFGASVNLTTNMFQTDAGARISSAYGSFNTVKINSQFNTGLLNNNWAFEGRLSKINSDGYIDRAFSDLKSYYFGAGYLGRNWSLRFTSFAGKERTYQAWWGTPDYILEEDRTYNYYTFENQTDNYQQDHQQLHFDWHLIEKNATKLDLSAALHYTKGKGYYEEFRANDHFADYGLETLADGTDTTDLVRQRWLDNDFLGGVYALKYDRELKNDAGAIGVIFGGNYNHYYGNHFGEIIWARTASNSFIGDRYYENSAFKRNWNNYTKVQFAKANWVVEGELQVRNVHYAFEGIDDDLSLLQHEVDFNFINPKVNLSYFVNNDDKKKIYAYYGKSNREPLRNDFVEVEPSKWPTHETVDNLELGAEWKTNNLIIKPNFYYMHFTNQLVLNGNVNDVGAYLRINVPESFRRGFELAVNYAPIKKLNLGGNITLSQNRIGAFTQFVESYDANWTWIGLQEENYSNTEIAFSPNTIAFAKAQYFITTNFSVQAQHKYVSAQYLDNTSNPERQLNAYNATDVVFDFQLFSSKWFKEIRINAMALNVFNNLFESNGYTWNYMLDGERLQSNAYYPQAGRNYMVTLSLGF
ncbi:MAG: TonB-dependent receptor [Bacteroidetes bacterium]|nr:TonB-dependent receptor [Bacteroidota bacterium]